MRCTDSSTRHDDHASSSAIGPHSIPLRPAAVASDWRNARSWRGRPRDGSERIRINVVNSFGDSGARRRHPGAVEALREQLQLLAQRHQRSVERAQLAAAAHPALIDRHRERHLVRHRHRCLPLQQQLVVVERRRMRVRAADATPGVTPPARGALATPFGMRPLLPA